MPVEQPMHRGRWIWSGGELRSHCARNAITTDIDRGRGLSAVACPSSSQCTAVDNDGYEITGVSQPHPATTSVSCSSSVFAPGDATVCRATVTDTAGSGQTAPTGNVSFTNSGTGRFFGSPCTLSGGGASASCAVVFTSFVHGGQVITANYGGDASHGASSGTTLVLVALPGSSSGCLLAGHGQITAANGDRAHFAMLVAATPTLGAERYRDKGPATPFRLRSTTVDALTCSRRHAGERVRNRDDQRRRLPPVSNRHPAERRESPGQLSHPAEQRLRLRAQSRSMATWTYMSGTLEHDLRRAGACGGSAGRVLASRLSEDELAWLA